jgi:hypothetical protein
VNCSDDRVFDHLGHRPAAETVPGFRGRLCEDRDLARRLFKAGKLELRVSSRKVVGIRFQRIGIARPEIIKHGAAACRIVDNDKAPRLTETNRRSQTRQVDEAFNCTGRQHLGAKAPYIATPDQELAQLRTENVVEPLHRLKLASHVGGAVLTMTIEPFSARRTTTIRRTTKICARLYLRGRKCPSVGNRISWSSQVNPRFIGAHFALR